MMMLKAIRLEKGLSVPQLVELSGIPRRTIQDIEKRGDCKVSTALKLANALDVTLDQLCQGKENQMIEQITVYLEPQPGYCRIETVHFEYANARNEICDRFSNTEFFGDDYEKELTNFIYSNYAISNTVPIVIVIE